MVAPWPLTGRTAQLEVLGRYYRDGSCGGVELLGPAGVGKTRLAEEALRLAERAGRRIVRAVGHPATQGIPLGALAHVLPATLVRGLGVGDDERTALFHAARAELRRLAEDGRLVLMVDDLDLLDDTSVAVLVPLIVSRTLFLIGTVRTGRSPSPPDTNDSNTVISSGPPGKNTSIGAPRGARPCSHAAAATAHAPVPQASVRPRRAPRPSRRSAAAPLPRASGRTPR